MEWTTLTVLSEDCRLKVVRIPVHSSRTGQPMRAVATLVGGLLFLVASSARAEEPDLFLGASVIGAGGTFNATSSRAAYTPALWIGGGKALDEMVHVGGFLRLQGYIPGGADLGAIARLALGPMPVAFFSFDIGPSLRTWGEGAYGKVPLDFGSTASAMGVQLSGTFSPIDLASGRGDRNSFAVTLGFDVAQGVQGMSRIFR